jgi:hypothetical protein
MFNVLSKILLKLDILAPTMELNINGGWAIRSWTGVFISIIYLAVAVYTTASQIQDFLNTTKPFIAVQLQLDTYYPSIDLVKNKHVPVMFAFVDSSTALKYDDMKYYFTFKYRQYMYIMPDGGDTFDISIIDLPTMACKDLIEKGVLDLDDYKNLGAYLDLLPEYGICIDPSGFNLTVVGSNYDPYEKFGYLEIFPCSLEDNSLCKPKDVVNTVWVQIIKTAVSMNLGDKVRPIRYESNADDFYALNTDQSQFYIQQLIMNEVKDEYGFLIPDNVALKYTTYDPPLFTAAWRDGDHIAKATDINSQVTKPYLTFEWCSGMKHNTITRTYSGFLDYLGNIGGINSIMSMVCIGIYSWWHWKQEKIGIVHAVYGLKKAPSKRKCWDILACCKKKNCSISSNNKVASKPDADFESSFTKQIGKNRRGVSTNPDINAHIEKGTIFVSSGVIDQAYDSIRGSLDLVTICKEINTVRFLATFFIKNYQKGLIPLVALSKTLQENKERLNIGKPKSNAVYSAMTYIASGFSFEEQEDDIIEGVDNLLKRMEEIKHEQIESDTGKHVNYGLNLESPLKSGTHSQAQSTMGTRSLVSTGLEMEMNSNLMEALTKVSSLVGIKSLVPDVSNGRSDLDFSSIHEDMLRPENEKSSIEDISMNNSPPQPISNSVVHKIKKEFRPRVMKFNGLSVQQ